MKKGSLPVGKDEAFGGKAESFPVWKDKVSCWEGRNLPSGKGASFPVGREQASGGKGACFPVKRE